MADEPNEEARIPISGIDDVIGTFADVFLIVREQETGIASIYFLQSMLTQTQPLEGTHRGLRVTKHARPVARILVSAKGYNALLEGLAENANMALVPKTEEKK